MKIELTKCIVKKKDRFLMLKKSKDSRTSNMGKWEAPGGKIDPGEKPEESMLRELKEETGIMCSKLNILITLTGSAGGIDSVCHVFFTEVNSSKVSISAEHDDYGWFTYEEILGLELVQFADLLLPYFKEASKRI